MNLFPVIRGDRSEKFYDQLDKFITDVHNSVVSLSRSVESYLNGNEKLAYDFGKQVISLEESADARRRVMERELYSGVLIPFGREDKYELIETIDDIADKAEIIARLSKYEKPKIPQNIKKDLVKLLGLVVNTSYLLKESVKFLSTDLDKAIKTSSKVNIEREIVRELEFKILKKLLSTPKIDFKTILLKELISLIGQVADKAEEASDRVISMAVKYQG